MRALTAVCRTAYGLCYASSASDRPQRGRGASPKCSQWGGLKMAASEPLSSGNRAPNGAPHPFDFFSHLVWLDGRPLLDTIEPLRRKIFADVLFTFEPNGALRYNFALCDGEREINRSSRRKGRAAGARRKIGRPQISSSLGEDVRVVPLVAWPGEETIQAVTSPASIGLAATSFLASERSSPAWPSSFGLSSILEGVINNDDASTLFILNVSAYASQVVKRGAA